MIYQTYAQTIARKVGLAKLGVFVPPRRAVALIAFTIYLTVINASVGKGETDQELDTLKARLAVIERNNADLQSKVTELENKNYATWLTEERTNQIRSIVEEVIAESKTHEQSATSNVGYQNGFYIQSADNAFKLVIGGLLQVRYEYAGHSANNNNFHTIPLTQGDAENASGIDIRRARLNFSGNAFSPNLFYRFEGDFVGSSSGGFTVTDAYTGYIFSDAFKIRAGAFKTPFTKAQLENDANLELERSEVNFPFDAQRSLGFSVFGDIIPNHWSYEVNVNDGSRSNTFHAVDTYNNVATVTSTSTPTYNLDNRLAFYGRMQYAGSGAISEFYDGGEADLRKNTQDLVWMLGVAAGYESQNSSGAAFAQNTLSIVGLGSTNSPGFTKAYILNGDIYRATADWSAKWHGFSINTAAYFQEINANPYAGTASGGLPPSTGKSAFYQAGYYGQIGYMILPRQLQIVGRAGYLFNEDDSSVGNFYNLGINYYLHGYNAKITADMSYTPEAAYTDPGTLQLINTHEIEVRLQFQLKF